MAYAIGQLCPSTRIPDHDVSIRYPRSPLWRWPFAAAVALAFTPISPVYAAAPGGKVSAEVAASANKAVLAIADEYYDAVARFEPIGSTENGDNRFDNQLGMSICAGQARRAIQAVPQIPATPASHQALPAGM